MSTTLSNHTPLLGESFANSAKSISSYHNPFYKDCIKCVTITYRPRIFNEDTWVAKAYVEFCSGPTKGEHTLEADCIENLLPQIAEFIKNL